MSMFGKALALLQQTETVLREQLNDVDLHQLRADTVAARGGALSPSAVERWKEVLLAVSPTMYDLGREMLRVHSYMDSRRKSLLMMQRIVWTVEAMVVMLSVISIGATLQGAGKREAAGKAVSAGMIVGLALFMFATLGSWSASMNEMYRKIRFQQNSPLHSVLLRFSDRLSAKFIVVFVAAIVTGRDVRRDVALYISDSKQSEAHAKAWANCKGARKPADDAGCVYAGLTACSLASTYTVSELDRYIAGYCTPMLVDIADALIDLSDNGTDRYLRGELWASVDTGVEAVRHLVMTQYDDEFDGDEPSYSADVVEAIVHGELVPALMLAGVQLSRTFDVHGAVDAASLSSVGLAAAAGDPADASKFGGGDGSSVTGPADEALCFRSCMASPGCRVAYFRNPAQTGEHGVCYVGSSYRAVGPASPFRYRGVGDGAASLYISRGGPADVLTVCSESAAHGPPVELFESGAPGVNGECASGSPLALYSAPAVAAALSSTMLDQATYLAGLVMAVLRRHRFRLRLADVRPQIDAELELHYGADAYRRSVSSAVDAVLKRAEDLALHERRQPRAVVDADRLLAKLRAMPAQEAGQLQTTLQDMRAAAVQHRDLFPAYRNASTKRVSTVVLVLGGLTLVDAYVVYLCVLYGMYMHTRGAGGRGAAGAGGHVISFSTMAQRAVVALCVLIITLFVMEVMATKIVSKSAHNMDMVDGNGDELVASAVRVVDVLDQLWVLTGRSKDVQIHSLESDSPAQTAPSAAALSAPAHVRAVAAGFLSQSALLVGCYAKCNSLTSGQASMPGPLPEVLMYGVVAGMFLVVTGISVYRIAPGEKVDTLRTLYSLVQRIKEGNIAAVNEAQYAVQCSRPPLFVWSIFVWYGIMLLVVVTFWFVTESQNAVSDYQDSLATRQDCV